MKTNVKCPIRPLGHHLVVLPDEREKQSKGGILLPDVAKQRSQRGRVLAVGPGAFTEDGSRRLPLDVVEGQTVLYGVYSGNEIELDGVEYKILRGDDVLGIVEL